MGYYLPREVQSRLEVNLEQYVMAITVEAKLVLEIGKTMIYPAAMRYQNELAATCAHLKVAGCPTDRRTLDTITTAIHALLDSLSELEALLRHSGTDVQAEADHACNQLKPALTAVRRHADELESWVADDLWPLPTYQEMLFIK